jgi:predicted dinucleotide-binding enzyme
MEPATQFDVPRRIAILGAGRVGSAVGRVALDAGVEVALAGSGSPEALELMASVLVPGAQVRDVRGAVEGAEVVVLAIPMHRFASIDPALLEGRIVIDMMNHWEPIDGSLPQFEDPARATSEVVAASLPGARVVKAFNHVGYHELEAQRRPAGAPDRQALGVAADDADARARVAALVDRMGFDVVELPSLRASRAFQPGGPVFGARLDRAAFLDAVSPP